MMYVVVLGEAESASMDESQSRIARRARLVN